MTDAREARAREVLAAEIERKGDGFEWLAANVRIGARNEQTDAAVRAMLAFADAERTAQPEAPEGWVMVPRELAERCDDILAWRTTGILEGEALSAYARKFEDTGSEPSPPRRAEMETVREVLRLCAGALAAAPTPAQSAPASDVLREALRLARPIVESDLSSAEEHCDADWEGMSRTALDAIDAALTTSAHQRDELVEVLKRIEPLVSQLALPSRLDPYHSREIRELGERIGYGALMHGASALWRVHLEENGGSGGEFVVGPCAATVDKAWTRLRHDIEEAKR